MASILGKVDKIKRPSDVVHVSNLIKQTRVAQEKCHVKMQQLPVPLLRVPMEKRDSLVHKFSNQNEKLKWVGVGLPLEEVYLVDQHLTMIAEQQKAEEVRFWGKILGTCQDYYVIQGRVNADGGLEDIPQGAEKRGEGVNYYTFWVNNNLLNDKWTELPLITPEHVKNSRKIKKCFTGELFRPFVSYPSFGKE